MGYLLHSMVPFFFFTCYIPRPHSFQYFYRIASAKSVHHLDGMVIATVMIISILKIVNGTEETAVGKFKQTSAL